MDYVQTEATHAVIPAAPGSFAVNIGPDLKCEEVTVVAWHIIFSDGIAVEECRPIVVHDGSTHGGFEGESTRDELYVTFPPEFDVQPARDIAREKAREWFSHFTKKEDQSA